MTSTLLGLLILVLVGVGCFARSAYSGGFVSLRVADRTASVASTPEPQEGLRPVKRLRILCLHGYHGSGEVLRRQMQSLVTGVKPSVELVYVDAPSLSAGDYGWWHAISEDGARGGDESGVGHSRKRYDGWERTRQALVSVFERQGPFDGIFGFSQGAALTGLLVGLRSPDGVPTPDHPLPSTSRSS